jgi:glutamate-ammonia-ligase adenylyltransferase
VPPRHDDPRPRDLGELDLEIELADPAASARALAALIAHDPALAARPDARELCATLGSMGDYPLSCVVAEPGLIAELLELDARDSWPSSAELREGLEALAPYPEPDDPLDAHARALRTCRRRELLWVFARESRGGVSVRESTAHVSRVASACLDYALGVAAHARGLPELTASICLIGMGKLGGRELNYASDVDLIAVCDDALPEAHARAHADAVLRDLVSLMEDRTRDGYAFRVDLRLRPQGSRGLLVPSVSACEEYYLNWGRTWERAALLKARPVAGARAIGRDLLARIEPFVYRRTLDYRALEELRLMKSNIDSHSRLSAVVGEPEPTQEAGAAGARSASARLARRVRARRARASPTRQSAPARETSSRGLLGWDTKLGRGGVREIEFFAQALQLVHSGRAPALRTTSTLTALDRLLYAGLVSHDDYATLADAYVLLRRVEHAVQVAHDRQDHRVPGDHAGFLALALRLGEHHEDLHARLERARGFVSAIFSRLFEDPDDRSPERPTLREASPLGLDVALSFPVEGAQRAALLVALRRAGFTRPRDALTQLDVLSSKDHGPFSTSSRTPQMARLGRFLLDACAASFDPGRALTFVTRLITTIGPRDWFYSMLADNPHTARLIVHVFGSSPALGAILLREPNVIGQLLSHDTAAPNRPHPALAADLERRLVDARDPGHRRGRLLRFQQEETLRIALHTAGGACHIRDTLAQLSSLAELSLDALMRDVWSEVRARLPDPDAAPALDDLGFCVVAMGKLGGRELGFGSDLDLFFVYDEEAGVGLTHEVYARLARRLMRRLSSVGEGGRLYEVDARLRPSGRQGALVVSLDALRDYHSSLAGLWERQALIKARALTGAPNLRARFDALRREVAFARPLPDTLRAQLATMRRRMRSAANLGPGFDVKRSPGGIIDVEFTTQLIQLELGGVLDDPALRSPSTERALRALARSDRARSRYPELDFSALARDYLALRRLEAGLTIVGEPHQSTLPSAEAERAALARLLGFHSGEAVRFAEQELERMRSRVEASWLAASGDRSAPGEVE